MFTCVVDYFLRNKMAFGAAVAAVMQSRPCMAKGLFTTLYKSSFLFSLLTYVQRAFVAGCVKSIVSAGFFSHGQSDDRLYWISLRAPHHRKSSQRIVKPGFPVSIYLPFCCEHFRLDDGMDASINQLHFCKRNHVDKYNIYFHGK